MLAQFPRQPEDRQIVLGKPRRELFLGEDFVVRVDLALDPGHLKMLAEEPVGPNTVLLLVVVCAGVLVFVPGEECLFAVQPEEGAHRIVDQRPDEGSAETAVVLGVVDEQGRARRHEPHQMREILLDEEITGRLFHVSEIAVTARFDTR